MASAATTATCALTSPAPADGRATPRLQAPHAVSLPSLSPQTQLACKTTNGASCKRIARKFVAMATGEAPAEVDTELPEFAKTLQAAWDKLEDKYAVTSLGIAAILGIWSSAGMISAIDRLPLVPGILELVGIGYSGWFAYRNLVFKPDREALIAKVKSIYCDVIGSS